MSGSGRCERCLQQDWAARLVHKNRTGSVPAEFVSPRGPKPQSMPQTKSSACRVSPGDKSRDAFSGRVRLGKHVVVRLEWADGSQLLFKPGRSDCWSPVRPPASRTQQSGAYRLRHDIHGDGQEKGGLGAVCVRAGKLRRPDSDLQLYSSAGHRRDCGIQSERGPDQRSDEVGIKHPWRRLQSWVNARVHEIHGGPFPCCSASEKLSPKAWRESRGRMIVGPRTSFRPNEKSG